VEAFRVSLSNSWSIAVDLLDMDVMDVKVLGQTMLWTMLKTTVFYMKMITPMLLLNRIVKKIRDLSKKNLIIKLLRVILMDY
jgi:hypothetical protein